MKRSLRLLLLAFLGTVAAHADEQVRAMQNSLQSEGFYYGELDGTAGPAFSAALRRYQIRHGLEVTGTATPETVISLHAGGGSAAEPSSTEPAAPETRQSPAPPKPPVDLRRRPSLVESDQRALEELQPGRRVERDPAVVSPPVDLYRAPAPANPRYLDVFAGSPFEKAPPQLQEQTLRAAQRMLGERGFYEGPADGLPGPATIDALVIYQRAERLPRTGRLDLETLSALRLLPGVGSVNPVLKPFTAPARQPRTYRGIWID